MATENVKMTAEESVDGHTFLSRLCSLFEQSINHRFTKLELTSLTKDEERELLISLSQIFNLIRRWTDELQLISDRSSGSSSTDSNCAEHDEYLTKIVANLSKDDAELVEVLLNSLGTCLKKVPWDLLKNIHNGSSTEIGGSSWEAEAKILLLGNFVQLLCSAIDLVGCAEGADSHYESAILQEACELVPRLLNCCLSEDWNHILPYFRHKILMLMIKLSFHMQLGCSILILWLQLLKKYYQDLLLGPIFQLERGQNDSLEGSPFLSALDGKEICHLSSCHVQRKAVFLFLRCSLSLISLSKTADFKCTCMRRNSFLEPDLNTVQYCFAEKKGLDEFYGWLQGHAPYIMCSESEVNLDKCINFTSSFIRFYMQELQYDHQVLLDYLISKDIGGKCAEYLLRCLRVVCDSWKLFVEYSVRESVCQSKCKRRRASHSDISEEQKILYCKQRQGEHKLRSKCFGIRSLQLEGAKECLLHLKSALRKLHRRKLFPYNPEVLIR
ncbi:Bacterial non-heme ferritin, partial [Bienertia sinuspersici]